ncbi:hypothetical protein CXK86_07310 [Paenibacillus sp. BGI2013]|uniref:EamA family transporter n=1 Tax=Paenibacillus TaxID=44249 RepID=UPI00096F5604|nr:MULTISPECIES: EamA family transporter [Paenibacillus]OMF39718.1 hypothetical protein BK136_26365 [Paenibacillus amylolyticus]PKQ92477.1 hypothetical protein CXK86_07310 [Paenibacillus sp. BGI2013]WKL03997.1 EamA family transporter [Paenibacillus amylolyticus]
MILLVSALLILINSFAQILLKVGAVKGKKNKAIVSINLPIVAGYMLFLISTVLSVYLLKFIALKNFTIIIALNYVGTLLFSYIFLKERFTKQKIIASFFIIAGVIIFNL